MAREMDSLTGLLKEEWLKQGLWDELNRAERFGRDLGLLLIEANIPADLVRDLSYPVLKKLGKVSNEVTRQVDVGIRIRNRLLWLLPETSDEGVQVAQQKIATKFAEENFVDSASGETFAGAIHYAYFVFPSGESDREDILNRLIAKLEETKGDEKEAETEAEAPADAEESPADESEG